MNWTDLLSRELESTYRSARGLIELTDDSMLNWKPPTGGNWMTTAKLLRHLTDACGSGFKGFVTGDWGMPEGIDLTELPPEEMLRPAEKLPAIESVTAALAQLDEDHRYAVEMLAKTDEKTLDTTLLAAPWNPQELALGYQLLLSIKHLSQHKAQLFFYLKMQGIPVHTGHLWGM